LPYVAKIKVSLCDPHPPLSTFECLKQSLWNLVCIMGTKLITTSHFIQRSQRSVPVSVSLLSVVGNGSANAAAVTNARRDRGFVYRVIFNVPCLSREILWIFLCIILPLLGNNWVKTFQRQLSIIEDVFYAVRIVSKDTGDQFFPEIIVLWLS
jgi:hypothetical protein